ncbi:hypothetical protein [Cupriavidus sp. DF5525]|uniref:hypothetical protein n=1 Tax=Cupriavidus sp. DF5525 TaxID=3160989 RepID=UPI0032DFF140
MDSPGKRGAPLFPDVYASTPELRAWIGTRPLARLALFLDDLDKPPDEWLQIGARPIHDADTPGQIQFLAANVQRAEIFQLAERIRPANTIWRKPWREFSSAFASSMA